MLEIVKLALGRRSDTFDAEINTYICACRNDLIHSGVNEDKLKEDDESYRNVVISYCKWFTNFQGEGMRWENIYKSLRASMVLDNRYH